VSAATGVPDFDRAEWRQAPVVRDVLGLPEFGVLRQSFDGSFRSFEVSVPGPQWHVLLCVLGQAPGRYEVRLGSRQDHAPGHRLRNAYLLPAGFDTAWSGPAARQHDCLHFHFSPGWLRGVAEESGLPASAADLPPRAGLDDPALDGLVRALTGAGETASTVYAEHWAVLAALRLLRMPPASGRLSIAPWRLARALALAESTLEEDISLSDLAAAAGLSRFHFARSFRAATGETPHAHLRRLRCERAKMLMEKGGMTLAEIALACGFAHQAHFTTVFRRVTGRTPARWREERLS
jgi:AraC-like DNA-binding protein